MRSKRASVNAQIAACSRVGSAHEVVDLDLPSRRTYSTHAGDAHEFFLSLSFSSAHAAWEIGIAG